MKATYPIRFSLPVTASRLMSAILSPPHAVVQAFAFLPHDIRRVEAAIAAVWSVQPHPFGGHPARPAELAEAADLDGRDLARRQCQFHLPIELVADIEEDRIDQRLATVAGGQEAHVFLQARGVDADADLVLDAVDRRAHHYVAAKAAVVRTQQAAVALLDHEARAGELLDLDAEAERAGDEGAQARGGLGLRAHEAGESHFGQVRYGIEIAVGRRADPDHGADIDEEAVGLRPVVLDDRPGVRPGAEEQLQEAMIEDVEEARKRLVAHHRPSVGLFGG